MFPRMGVAGGEIVRTLGSEGEEVTARWTPQDLVDYQQRRDRKTVFSKLNKYGAKRTEIDGIVFASKREASRYSDLKVMQEFGLISGLALQVKYDLVVNGMKICSYCSDFNYIEDGKPIVEDAKGVRTPAYKLKKKLMLAIFGIEIREV